MCRPLFLIGLFLACTVYHVTEANTILELVAIITDLQEQLEQLKSKPCATPEPAADPGQAEAVFQRVQKAESRVKTLMDYLRGEKKKDTVLRKESELVINDMKAKITETDGVIGELRQDVDDTLSDFEDRIVEVKNAAEVKVNANGAVLYGGVGSACSTDDGECTGVNSECRDGKCQCIPGYSFDRRDRSCKSTCNAYGTTYQSVRRKIIRGHNDLALEDTDLTTCINRCNTENAFVCRSFDYFPRWKSCYLSSNVKSDVPAEAWEYNMAGYHYQRDCKF